MPLEILMILAAIITKATLIMMQKINIIKTTGRKNKSICLMILSTLFVNTSKSAVSSVAVTIALELRSITVVAFI